MSRLSEHDYDLCFTDMRLPDGNGQDIVAHVAKHKVPRHVRFFTEPLPRNASGKFLRRDLRDQFAADTAEA